MLSKDIMTLQEVADFLGCPIQTLYNMRCKDGKLPFPTFKMGSRIMARRSKLLAWIAEQEK